jgi:hypothetical protein
MFDKLFKKDIITLRKYKPNFTTTDGNKHEGTVSRWAIKERLKCSIPQYLMINITSDGYIEDKEKIMYPLTNIISIEWEVVEEIKVEDRFSEFDVFINQALNF